MKDHIKVERCAYISLGMGEDFCMCSYCTKQTEYPDDIHKNMKCKECKDYVPYEYTMEVSENY